MTKNKNKNIYYGDLFIESNDEILDHSLGQKKTKKNKKSNYIQKLGNEALANKLDPSFPDRHIFQVSEINEILKELLEQTFAEVWIQGEISNSKLHTSGHFYCSLKDENSQLKAIMFKQLYNYLKFEPKDGMKVLVKGNISCFVKAGTYQVNIIYMEPQGIGALQLAFEQLKEKLFKEGLFDAIHKKPIPLFPQKIGVITSPTGAAIRDILAVLKRRYSNLNIIIYPVKVQGDSAKFEIVEALSYFNNVKDEFEKVDVILLGRGGGSIEDLWAFNEEIVARAIFKSDIPIISSVGHEIDFVISDFVADMRAPTPSAGAEILIKDKTEIKSKLNFLTHNLQTNLKSIINNYEKKLKILQNTSLLKNPYLFFLEKIQTLDLFTENLIKNIEKKIEYCYHKKEILQARLFASSSEKILEKGYFVLKDNSDNILNMDQIECLKENEKIKFINKKYEIFCRVLKKIKKF
ncbi:MAG: exodeoxyribonuclease VII large subunit [Elusimicrobiota bacterium]|jgi:exodeoxyribonuclease VII large subunit|nr:exodeoxyribonuclease VII large subunit [Elusimicrobiota bacterium]